MKESGVIWLGEIPEHWDVVPLKAAFTRVKRKPSEGAGIVTAFRDGEVTLRSNRRSEGYTEADDYSGYQRILPGDLAIHSMDSFAGAIGVSDSDGMCSPVLSVCIAKNGNDPRFMAYQLRLMASRGWIEALSRSIRERTSEFRWAEAGKQKVALPPIGEQKAIADFLDHELRAIDRVIKTKLALLSQLQDWYVAYLCKLVTRGLNSAVTFDPTSFEWCTLKPVHWREVPLFTLGSETSLKNRGSQEDNLLSLSYGEIVKKDINTNEGLLPESFDTYQIIEPGDIVFRFTDLQNDKKSLRSALSRDKGIITSAYLAFRVTGCSPEFLALQMRAWDLMKVFYAMGSGLRQSLKFSDVKRMPVLLPPLEEQAEIVQALQKRHSKIKELKGQIEIAIEILKERRSTLISAAVTGKMDIQGKN